MEILPVILIISSFVLYIKDQSYSLVSQNGYQLQKRSIEKYKGLPLFELDYLIDGNEITPDHRNALKRYRKYRIIGHWILFSSFVCVFFIGLLNSST